MSATHPHAPVLPTAPSPARPVLLALTLSLALSLCPVVLLAQATETERQAGKAVLERIDALEAQLQPARLAARIAAKKDPARDAIYSDVAKQWTSGGLQDLSDWITKHPEVGWKEIQAVDTLTKVLEADGFTVEKGVAGLKTAFVASWTSPAGADGPTLGLIGEYDALRGTQGDFHGDQHSAQTPVAIAAARAIMHYMTSAKRPGRVVLYGTPAEEVDPPAKAIMYKAGVFKGADILVRSHSSMTTGHGRAGFGSCCLDINAVKYVFHGRPAHQLASWNGRNALEAAVSFYTAVDRLRSTLRPEARIQGIIPEGGAAPNVVPDRAAVEYFIRYPDEVYLAHIDTMMAHAAAGAAEATGTTVEIQREGEYRDGVTVGTLEELKYALEKQLGAPGIEDEAGRPAGYEETGLVTREIPGVGVTVHSSNSPNHTYGMYQDALTDVGHTGFLFDAKLEAGILYTYLTEPAFRAQVKREHDALAGLFGEYLDGLRKVYAPELGTSATSEEGH